MNRTLALAHFRLGLLSNAEIRAFADAELTRGIYSDSLNKILCSNAVLGANDWNLPKLFKTALNEIGGIELNYASAAIQMINASFLSCNALEISPYACASCLDSVLYASRQETETDKASAIAITRALFAIYGMYDSIDYFSYIPAIGAIYPRDQHPFDCSEDFWAKVFHESRKDWLEKYDHADAEKTLAEFQLDWERSENEEGA
jgi:hypothetical protein